MFVSEFEEAFDGLPDAWRTATFELRIENPVDTPGRVDLSPEEAVRSIEGIAMCRPTRSPTTPNTWRITVGVDGTCGITRELARIGMAALDRYRLRGELRLATVETTTQDA